MASPAPAGLATLTGFSSVPAPAEWEHLDSFVTAVGVVEAEYAKVTAWVANPVDTTALAVVKASAGSNVNPLDADPTSVTGRTILGRPLFSTPAVPVGTVRGMDSSRVMLVDRDDASIDVDSSVFSTSDRIAVRGKMRAAFGFIYPAASRRLSVPLRWVSVANAQEPRGWDDQADPITRLRASG